MPRKSVVRLTDRHDVTLDVYCGRKTTIQQVKFQLIRVKYLCYNGKSFFFNFQKEIELSIKQPC